MQHYLEPIQVLAYGEYVGAVRREIRSDGMLASVSTYEETLFNNGWHCHEHPHVSFVLNGGCSERKKNDYERLPGITTVYLGGEPHQITAMSSQSTHINVEFEKSFLARYELPEESFARAVQSTPDMKLMMLRIYRELGTDDVFSPTSIEMLLLGFLQQAKERTSDRMPGWIRQVHAFMHDQWADTLALDQLAEVAGVHPGTVSHYFPKYFSCTLGNYMRKLKVEKALLLIKANKLSLTEVAYECGFFDQSHFIRTFRQFTGFLPAQYRKL